MVEICTTTNNKSDGDRIGVRKTPNSLDAQPHDALANAPFRCLKPKIENCSEQKETAKHLSIAMRASSKGVANATAGCRATVLLTEGWSKS